MLALAAAVVVGAVLRLIWPGDMEYRYDEMYLFHHATGPRPFPWLGENSGVGLQNPGMGIWVYSLMARAADLSTPLQLVHGVVVLNIIALFGLAAFSLRVVPARQREPWLWATALVAVNPVAILFSRKLWIQSALPPFVVAMLLAWWRRGSRRGAFAWGLVGAWLGQIHMSGFFFAGGFALWTALFDRRSVRWPWWLLGSLLGAATLEPWLVHVVGSNSLGKGHTQAFEYAVPPRFFFLWFANSLGLTLLQLPAAGSSLGLPHAILAWPTIGGTSTYLCEITVAVIATSAVVIAAQAVLFTFWSRRRGLGQWLSAWRSHTGLAIGASLIGFGVLITASGVPMYRHYLIVAYALPFVSIAVVALVRPRSGRWLLAVLVIAQMALSVQYMTYIHAGGHPLGSDYGIPYDRQGPGNPHPGRS